ncbi:MAG TPA: histidine kinase dimerization/phosphoacceptor domain -containing protein [Alphaproteobacteria bacterium]
MVARSRNRRGGTSQAARSGGHRAGGLFIDGRSRQREILASLGILCLRGLNIGELLDRAARLAAEGLGAVHSAIAEFLPAENKLLIRAGVGWTPGVVGTEKLEADIGSPAGFALRTGQPVISHLDHEQPFRTPGLLLRHGIKRTITVIVAGDHTRFGVLEVDSALPGEFTADDLPFVQGLADMLGVTIEKRNIEHELRSALEWQKILLDELNHRVKNSLQLAATSLLLEAGTSDFEEVRHTLQQASTRIAAIAQVHKNLATTSHGYTVEICHYFLELRDALRASGLNCDCDVATVGDLYVSAERAVPIGLLVNELVTNAAKHGGAERSHVRIRVERDDGSLSVSVRDDGPGLPSDFDMSQSKGLGMRIIRGLAGQIGGALSTKTGPQGTEVVLRVSIT